MTQGKGLNPKLFKNPNKGVVMKNFKWITVIIITSGLIAFWFYWFQWRPSQIRKECSKYPDKTTKSSLFRSSETTENEYTDCLHKNGLK